MKYSPISSVESRLPTKDPPPVRRSLGQPNGVPSLVDLVAPQCATSSFGDRRGNRHAKIFPRDRRISPEEAGLDLPGHMPIAADATTSHCNPLGSSFILPVLSPLSRDRPIATLWRAPSRFGARTDGVGWRGGFPLDGGEPQWGASEAVVGGRLRCVPLTGLPAPTWGPCRHLSRLSALLALADIASEHDQSRGVSCEAWWQPRRPRGYLLLSSGDAMNTHRRSEVRCDESPDPGPFAKSRHAP